jgi:hypothetical protein
MLQQNGGIMKARNKRVRTAVLGQAVMLIALALVSAGVHAENCPNFSGKYASEDSTGNYVIVYSQTACTTLTQKVIDQNGHVYGPVQAKVDDPEKNGCFGDRTCLMTAYWFTESKFQTFRVSVDDDQTTKFVTYTSMSKTENGDLRVERVTIDSDGKKLTKIDKGVRMDGDRR